MANEKRTSEDYKDIINLPHHVSSKRAKMPMSDRAAQFSPFAAVVGHDTAIKETARHTKERKELDEMEKTIIDEKLREIYSWLPEEREVEIVYFQPDTTKTGGSYLSKVGVVKKIDSYNGSVLFIDGVSIVIEDIYSIEL